jgi:hypothetical protein
MEEKRKAEKEERKAKMRELQELIAATRQSTPRQGEGIVCDGS